MRKFLVALAICLSLSAPAWAWTIVHRTVCNAQASFGSSYACTIPSTSAGNALIVTFVGQNVPTDLTTPTASGVTFTQVWNSAASSNSCGAMYYATGIPGSVTTVTLTASAGEWLQGEVREVSGMQSAGLDKTATYNASTGTTVATNATSTLTVSGELGVAACNLSTGNAGPTITGITNSYASANGIVVNTGGNTSLEEWSADNTNVGTAATSTGGTWNGNSFDLWGCDIATFKPAATGPGRVGFTFP